MKLHMGGGQTVGEYHAGIHFLTIHYQIAYAGEHKIRPIATSRAKNNPRWGHHRGLCSSTFRAVREPTAGIEPATYSLRVNCSTD